MLIRSMTDDEAVILMVDSNIQRENLLPSEKAFAYKMKLEAMKHQGKVTSCKDCTKTRSDEMIAQEAHVSARTIQNYIFHHFLLSYHKALCLLSIFYLFFYLLKLYLFS